MSRRSSRTSSPPIGETLTTINSRFKDVESAKVDAAAGAYIGPLAALAGAIGEVALSRTRDAMLKTAIEQAAPKVDQVLDLMHQDFAPVLISQRRLGEVEKLSDMVLAYNDGDPALRSSGSPSCRRRSRTGARWRSRRSCRRRSTA